MSLDFFKLESPWSLSASLPACRYCFVLICTIFAHLCKPQAGVVISSSLTYHPIMQTSLSCSRRRAHSGRLTHLFIPNKLHLRSSCFGSNSDGCVYIMLCNDFAQSLCLCSVWFSGSDIVLMSHVTSVMWPIEVRSRCFLRSCLHHSPQTLSCAFAMASPHDYTPKSTISGQINVFVPLSRTCL